MARISTGKRQRFRIFSRDGYTCRYCGAQPPNVTLQVDHVIPVAEGGTDDDSNLITACKDCNAGKSKFLLSKVVPTDSDNLRIAQELKEQIDLATIAKDAAKSRMELREVLAKYWAQVFNNYEPKHDEISRLVSLAWEFGPDVVMDWIDQTNARGIYGWKAVQYLGGIAKNHRSDSEKEEESR